MIRLTPSASIMIGAEPIDFRRQLDGLAAHCRQGLAATPMSGTWCVFINRAHTMIHARVCDGSGFWLMTKRLSSGRFSGWPSGCALSPMAAKTLISIARAIRRNLKLPAQEPEPLAHGPP